MVINNEGWVCPRCNKVNAPWKSQCDCVPTYYGIPITDNYYGGSYIYCPICKQLYNTIELHFCKAEVN
jgi:hypothetical protein